MGEPDGSTAICSRIAEHPVLGPWREAAPIAISVDGVDVAARDGETIAAALLIAGLRVFRTMPRSGEARGPYCMVGRCADCLVVVDGRTSVRACVTPARAGMRIATQHGLGEREAVQG